LKEDKMQSIDANYANLANYDLSAKATKDQRSDYYALGSILVRHRSPFGTSNFWLPKTWATSVIFAVREMIALNESIKFVDIREEHSKLILNFHYTGDFDPRIHERSRRIKNYIDNFVHAKVSQFEVSRKFQHETRQFY